MKDNVLTRGDRRVVVNVDLSKFFDRVNHDILMGKPAKRIADKTMLGLGRRYLNAGIMASGVATRRQQGTPQGGPLSPLLANLLLDDVDKELERRGHAFARYAAYGRSSSSSGNAVERSTVSSKLAVFRQQPRRPSPSTGVDGGWEFPDLPLTSTF